MVIGVFTFKRAYLGCRFRFRGRTRRYREIGEAAQLDEELRRRSLDRSMAYKSHGRSPDDRQRGALFIPQIGATLTGTSISGIGTTIFVKKFGVCFDAGRYHEGSGKPYHESVLSSSSRLSITYVLCPLLLFCFVFRVEGASVYAITHGHSDHIGALHHILRVRGQNRAGSPPPTVVLPDCYKTNWVNLLKESTLLDAGPNGTPIELERICSVYPTPYEEVSK
mmetsp:Transcript_45138/g.175148  ORF Transcript_45138/g.175148 Transcript_45138/m.175148 type:complete len:223 (-) Transcript_45138:2188-2856(-)